MTTLSLTPRASPLLRTMSLEPLLLRLHASVNISQFWPALQSLLRHAAPYDALVVYLNFFDFASSWRAATILATPNAMRPTTWFEARRQVDMTPQFVLSHQKRIKLYRLSDVVADVGSLRRTAFFKDFLVPGGWHHLAVILFWQGSTVCSEIALRRTKDQGDFTEAEMKLLAKLHSHVEIVLNRLIQQEEERARRCWMEEFNDHLPFALLFLNFELQAIYANREALEQCAMWNFGPDRAQAFQPREVFRVPDEILRACADLKTQWLLRAPPTQAGPNPSSAFAAATPGSPN